MYLLENPEACYKVRRQSFSHLALANLAWNHYVQIVPVALDFLYANHRVAAIPSKTIYEILSALCPSL